DSESIEEAKRRKADMAKTWREIFEIDQEINTAVNTAVNAAVNNTTRTNLYDYVQKGGMSIDFAAGEAGITTEQFRSEMASHGYSVPQAV
ncbi:MAG: hypothetical protein IJU50_02000, partial [Lachnospiraceae bacterium]|nr:hypothetical protein [Lachnospiraceae bacterium]